MEAARGMNMAASQAEAMARAIMETDRGSMDKDGSTVDLTVTNRGTKMIGHAIKITDLAVVRTRTGNKAGIQITAPSTEHPARMKGVSTEDMDRVMDQATGVTEARIMATKIMVVPDRTVTGGIARRMKY